MRRFALFAPVCRLVIPLPRAHLNAIRDLLGTSLGVNTCIRRKTPALSPAAEAEALRQAAEAPAPSTRQVARALRVARPTCKP
jgi:hypothetical protein